MRLPASRSLSCGGAARAGLSAGLCGIVAPDDIPVTRRVMVRGEPEHGFERDVPVEAPIVSEDKLVEIRVDVLAAQPMISAERPTFHQREDAMYPGQHDIPAI